MPKTSKTHPASSSSATTTQAGQKMDRALFEKLLKLYTVQDVSIRFNNHDLSDVLPDVEALYRALERIPANRKKAFLQTVGANRLRALFATEGALSTLLENMGDEATEFLRNLGDILPIHDYIHSRSPNDLVRLIKQLPAENNDGRLLTKLFPANSFNALVPSQDDLISIITALDNERDLSKLSRLLTTNHREKLVFGEHGLSGFLNRVQGNADRFLQLFRVPLTQCPAQNIGDFQIVLKRIHDNASRVLIIQKLAEPPDHLADFDDNALIAVLNELDVDNLKYVLTHCVKAFAERPTVLQKLAESRMNNIQIADVFIKEYLGTVTPDVWRLQWKVIVEKLISQPGNRDALFLNLGEASAKDVLDLYETMTNALRAMVQTRQTAKLWVDNLLVFQGGWGVLAKLHNEEENYRRDVTPLQSTGVATFLCQLMWLPFVIASSVLGIIPAIIAGIIHVAKVKPLQTEIDRQLAEFPGRSSADLLNGYDSVKTYHADLKTLRFFSGASSTTYPPLVLIESDSSDDEETPKNQVSSAGETSEPAQFTPGR